MNIPFSSFKCAEKIEKKRMRKIVSLVCLLVVKGSSSFAPFRTIRHDNFSKTASCNVQKVGGLAMDTSSITEAWDAYNLALENDPLLTKSLTAGLILGAADLSGQALERSQDSFDKSLPVDYARVARFAIFGLVLQAPWNHFYYQILDGALPPTEDPFTTTTGIKVVIDQFFQAPIFTVLIFYFLGLLEGKTIDSVKQQLDKDYKDTMIANCT